MQSPETRVETIDSTKEVDLAVHDFGGSGPPLLLSHATGFNALAYQPMLPTLTAAFHVWAFDFRGHGASTSPADNDFAWTNFADDVLRVIDHLGGEPVVAFGHSMGATALLLAEMKQPGSVTAAWMFEPIVIPQAVTERNSMMAEGARRRRAIFDSREQALARYASRPPLGTWRADALAGYVAGGFSDLDDGTVHLACHPETEAAVFEGANTYTNDVAAFAAPAVIAGGVTEDRPSPADWIVDLAAAMPNATHRRYDALTHFGPFQAPDQIAAHATAFLEPHTQA